MSVRETVTVHSGDRGRNAKKAGDLTDTMALLDSRSDSPGVAVLVARLEETLGYDPFTQSEDVFCPVTVGDFIRFYENAAGAATADSRQAG